MASFPVSVGNLYDLLSSMDLPIKKINNTRHYWFIRTQGGSYFGEFFLDDFVAIGHEDVPCCAEEQRTTQLIEEVKENHPQSTRVLNQVYKFCKEMHKGDIVIIPSESSAKFAFGYIEDEEVYHVKVSEEDVDEGKCPYTRRRKTHWLRGIPKSRVDSKLYTFFRNQQALSQVDDYSEFIDRAIHPFYIKNDIAHFTLSIHTPDSPDAFDIPLYMQGILIRAKALSASLAFEPDTINLKSRTNVQSEGLIELLGNPAFVALVGIVVVGLFGGTLKFTFTEDKKEGEVKTDGLIGAVLKIMEQFKSDKFIGDKEMIDTQKRLQVEDPRNKKEKG